MAKDLKTIVVKYLKEAKEKLDFKHIAKKKLSLKIEELASQLEDFEKLKNL